MSACIKAGIVGGIILFIWYAVSWMVLPWHASTLNGFKDEKAVSEVIIANAPQSGIYLLPSAQMSSQEQSPEMVMFASVHQVGTQSMMMQGAVSLVTQIISALLVAWLLCKTAGLGYAGRVGFVVVFALAASFVSHVPYWNWFYFNSQFTLVQVADLLVGWFLAGLVMAKMCVR